MREVIKEFFYGKSEKRESKFTRSTWEVEPARMDLLRPIMDKRFNSLFSDDYTRVKYKLKGFDLVERKQLAYMPEYKFFKRYYKIFKDDLEEFKQQVLVGRISEYTLDLLTYVSILNISYYPNGRYDRWIPDEMIVNKQYKLKLIEKNLLEG